MVGFKARIIPLLSKQQDLVTSIPDASRLLSSFWISQWDSLCGLSVWSGRKVVLEGPIFFNSHQFINSLIYGKAAALLSPGNRSLQLGLYFFATYRQNLQCITDYSA